MKGGEPLKKRPPAHQKAIWVIWESKKPARFSADEKELGV